jgi:hypothetical protein
MMARTLTLVLISVGALAPIRAAAQEDTLPPSLLGAAGLGRRVLPLDARARGMGNAGVALHDGNLSGINPAAAARFNSAGIWATFMPESRSVKGDFANGDFKTEDVPVIRLVFPIGGRWATSISAGGYLDQDWGVEFIDTLRLASEDVAFKETRRSDGGVTQFRAELAGVIAEGWSIGGGFLFYSGENRRRVQRSFSAESGFSPYEAETTIKYTGWGLALGFEWQPIPEMILGLTGSWNADLDIKNDSTGQSASVGLPLTLDVGGSWELTPGLLVALAGGWENWSAVADELPLATASDIWRFGGGLELEAASNQNTRLVVRAGAHADRQPFGIRGNSVWERGLSLGLGTFLVQGRARMDVTFEFGKRGNVDKNAVEESYKRFAIGAAVFPR